MSETMPWEIFHLFLEPVFLAPGHGRHRGDQWQQDAPGDRYEGCSAPDPDETVEEAAVRSLSHISTGKVTIPPVSCG